MSLVSDPPHSRSSRRMGPGPRPKNALKNGVEPVSVQNQQTLCIVVENSFRYIDINETSTL